MLARVVLKSRYGCEPRLTVMDPRLESMLAAADAALLIGDSALRVDVESLDTCVYDLGAEWFAMTGLPMVFAVWAGRPERVAPLVEAGFESAFRESLQFGLDNMDAIVTEESRARGFPRALVRRYLTSHIAFHIGEHEELGMERFLQAASELEAQPVA
jgi:predicted solute-binding protein